MSKALAAVVVCWPAVASAWSLESIVSTAKQLFSSTSHGKSAQESSTSYRGRRQWNGTTAASTNSEHEFEDRDGNATKSVQFRWQSVYELGLIRTDESVSTFLNYASTAHLPDVKAISYHDHVAMQNNTNATNDHALDDPFQSASSFDIVLGHVTPWREQGYGIAEQFSRKFTHVAANWFQILPLNTTEIEEIKNATGVGQDVREGQRFMFGGLENLQHPWLHTASMSHMPALVPRFSLENFEDLHELQHLLSDYATLALQMGKVCRELNATSVLLDAKLLFFKPLRSQAIVFLRGLGMALGLAKVDLWLALPGNIKGKKNLNFGGDEILALKTSVKYFVLQVRDVKETNPTPRRGWLPQQWLAKSLNHTLNFEGIGPLLRNRLIVEFSMHGRLYGGVRERSVDAENIRELLQHHMPSIEYNADSKEHSVSIKVETNQNITTAREDYEDDEDEATMDIFDDLEVLRNSPHEFREVPLLDNDTELMAMDTSLPGKFLMKHEFRQAFGADSYLEKWESAQTVPGAYKIYFPTLFALQDRFTTLRESGVAGVSIYELGAAFEYQFDLLANKKPYVQSESIDDSEQICGDDCASSEL